MVDKNYESQGQQSPNLHNNGRHVGFFKVIGYGHYFTEGLVFLSRIFIKIVRLYMKFDAKWPKI